MKCFHGTDIGTRQMTYFEYSTSCVQNVGYSYWGIHCKGELETVSVLVQSGSGLQLHAFLVRAGISFSPDLPLHINKI